MDSKEAVEKLMNMIQKSPEAHLDGIFIRSLQLRPEQVSLVNFVFWLCYMTETDLNMAFKKISDHLDPLFSAETNAQVQKMIADGLKGYSDKDADIEKMIAEVEASPADKEKILAFIGKNYSKKPVFSGLGDLPFFLDKIKVYEFLFGKTKRLSLLKKINTIRNDLSHNRVASLSYNGESLALRETKEKIIRDYFETVLEEDRSKSPIWNSLTPDIIAEIEQMKKDHPYPSPVLQNRVDEEQSAN